MKNKLTKRQKLLRRAKVLRSQGKEIFIKEGKLWEVGTAKQFLGKNTTVKNVKKSKKK
jgi:hypothetical protein